MITARRMVGMAACLTVGFVLRAGADVSLPPIFSDGAVLQRDLKVPVWGWADDGEKVTVSIQAQTVSTVAGADGRWRLNLNPLKTGFGPFEMTVEGNNRIVIKGIKVGEVWFGAGQSNMMMALRGCTGGKEFFDGITADELAGIGIVGELGGLASTTAVDRVKARWTKVTPGFSGVSAYFSVKLYRHFKGEVPVGMITYTEILPAEAWVHPRMIEEQDTLWPLYKHPIKAHSKLYNGVINATAPYAIRGALYYQAEYNGGRGVEFRYVMPALIQSWRTAWEQPEMPFLFVHLPGFVAQKAPPNKMDMDSATLAMYRHGQKYTWVGVRDAQVRTWRNDPHSGMPSAIDLGEDFDIHPPNKEPIGDRAVLAARKVAYGEDVVESGPLPRKVVRKESTLVVAYDFVGCGLVGVAQPSPKARAGAGLAEKPALLGRPGADLTGFEIAGNGLRYVSAKAVIAGNTVVLSAPEVKQPVAFRYAWRGNPSCTLYNKEGLPALPFEYLMPGEAYPSDTGSFSFNNPDFKQAGKAAAEPALWNPQKGALWSKEKSSSGMAAVVLTKKDARISQVRLADGAGVYWNCPPFKPDFVRPGGVVGYNVDLAGKGAKVYMNLCAGDSGQGYQEWGGISFIETQSDSFATPHIAQRIADKISPTVTLYRESCGGRFIRMDEGDAPVYLDNFSDVEIIRPLLFISDRSPVDLGVLGSGEKAESKAITISNTQDKTLPKLLKDDAEVEELKTILYGCAGFERDGLLQLQKQFGESDHVGAVLIGENDRMRIEGGNVSPDGRALTLMGYDSQPGLMGGEGRESETFKILFTGADEPGVHEATLRIVTQACNAGRLSEAKADEPPVNLYYVDIPIKVTVR